MMVDRGNKEEGTMEREGEDRMESKVKRIEGVDKGKKIKKMVESGNEGQRE